MISGQEIARKLGNIQADKRVLIGAFSNFFPEIKEETVDRRHQTTPGGKLHELNIKAFHEGRRLNIILRRERMTNIHIHIGEMLGEEWPDVSQ